VEENGGGDMLVLLSDVRMALTVDEFRDFLVQKLDSQREILFVPSAPENSKKTSQYASELLRLFGKGGTEVEQSEHWIDKKHLEYWDECIDESFRPVDLEAAVVMIPEKIRGEMKGD